MKTPEKKTASAFTLSELMMSVGIGTLVIAVLLTASVALQRGFAAVEGYAVAEGDQLRVQDYVALDCRRAIRDQVGTATGGSLSTPAVVKGSWINSGSTWAWAPDDSKPVTLILSLPNYYDASGNPQGPSFDVNFKVQYGDGAIPPTPISYYKSGNNFIRQVGTNPTDTAKTKAIATNVSSFDVTPLDESNSDGTISCSIAFAPAFTRLVGRPKGGTTIYAQTFLRNAQARQ
jgi:hypothetical protein